MNPQLDLDGWPKRPPHECDDCKSRHTPLPWEICEWDGHDGLSKTIEIFGGGTRAALKNITHPLDRIDALFIVRTVNSQKQLVDTLQWIAETIHQAHHQDQTRTFMECPRNTCEAAKKALIDAEEK